MDEGVEELDGTDLDDIDVYFSYFDGGGNNLGGDLDPGVVAKELKTKGMFV